MEQFSVLIGIVLIGVVIYLLVKNKDRFQKVPLDTKFNSNSNLNNQQYKALAIGSVCALEQSAYLNSLTTGLAKDKVNKILVDHWGINDTQEAIEALDSLQRDLTSRSFNIVSQAFTKENDKEAISFIEDNLSQNTMELDRALTKYTNLSQTYKNLLDLQVITNKPELETLGISGWTLARMVFLARLCFDASFLDESQGWQYINNAQAQVKQKFTSWKSLGNSYVLGCALTQGKEAPFSQSMTFVNSLLSRESSPWVKLNF